MFKHRSSQIVEQVYNYSNEVIHGDKKYINQISSLSQVEKDNLLNYIVCRFSELVILDSISDTKQNCIDQENLVNVAPIAQKMIQLFVYGGASINRIKSDPYSVLSQYFHLSGKEAPLFVCFKRNIYPLLNKWITGVKENIMVGLIPSRLPPELVSHISDYIPQFGFGSKSPKRNKNIAKKVKSKRKSKRKSVRRSKKKSKKRSRRKSR